MKNTLDLKSLLKTTKTEYEKFHSETKIKKLARNRNSKFWPEEWKKIFYKAYPRFSEIELPVPNLSPSFSLMDALKNRRSVREFSKKPLSLEKLSTLLYYSAGIKDQGKNQKRFYPSGGGRYPLEIYVLSLNSTLPRGVYHYYVKKNSLEKIYQFRKNDLKKITNLKWIENSGCVIIFTALFKRNIIKYGNRGYRHIMSETGHLAQNMYLLSTGLNIACCAVGGYKDDEINRLLDIDGQDESVVYFLAIGEGKR